MTPMVLPDGVRVEAQVLWGSIGWATPAASGVALADPDRRTGLITGEGSHQLTANEIGAMGRFGADVIVFVLNNSGYLIERALEEIRTGRTTILRRGITPSCRRRSDAPIGARPG